MLDSTTFDITVNIDLSQLSRQHTNVESNKLTRLNSNSVLGSFFIKATAQNLY